MSKKADGRGSTPQRYLFNLAKELYSDYTVVYEQDIPSIGQRFDIFIKELGIAIEYDGDQHDHFVEHFHGDMNGFIYSLQLDSKKESFAKENGIKLIRFKGKVMEIDINQLSEEIEKVEFPQEVYSMDIFKKEDVKLRKAKEYRKERYERLKSKKT